MRIANRLGVFAAVVIGIALLQSLSCSARAATTCDGAMVPVLCRTVVSDVATLHSANPSPGQYITITCYSPSTTKTICAGGGDFDRATSCGTDTDNGATILQDNVTPKNCYYRKNFGLNGVVDARQCGVIGDGATTSDMNTLNSCMLLAAAHGIYKVFTGGGVILDTHASTTTSYNVALPAGMTLTCGGNNLGLNNNNNYMISNGLTNAIVLDLHDSIVVSDQSTSPPAQNTTLEGCNILAGTTDTGTVTNPYSPSVWYPKCPPATTPCGTPGGPFLRSALQEIDSFNPRGTATYSGGGPAASSVAVQINGEHTAVRNVTALGFGTCFAVNNGSMTTGGKRFQLQGLIGDCNIGISVNNLPSGGEASGLNIAPFLTRNDGTAEVAAFNISSVGTMSGSIRLGVAGTGCSGFYFKNGDTVWVGTGKTNGFESAGGRWTVSNASICSVVPQGITLQGSVAGSISATGITNGPPTIGNPANAVTGVAGANAGQIAVGQKVTDTAGCIPASPETTVQDVWLARQIVYLSAAATCSSGSDSLTFANHATAPSGACGTDSDSSIRGGCVIVAADTRVGDGIVLTNAGGLNVTNCTSFGHDNAFHMSTRANDVRFANCNTGENLSLPDDQIISLLIDGDHSGGDACDIGFTNSILGQRRPVAVVVNSDCNDPNLLTNVTMGGSGGLHNGVSLELDAGTVMLSNVSAPTPSNVFMGDTAYMISSPLITDINNSPGSGFWLTDVLTGTLTGGTCSPATASLPITALDSAGGIAAYGTVTAAVCTSPPTAVSWSGGHGMGFKTGVDVALGLTLSANRLTLGNALFPKASVYLQNLTAGNNTTGCGNTFGPALGSTLAQCQNGWTP